MSAHDVSKARAVTRPATADDIAFLAPRLREADVQEIGVMNPGKTPLQILERAESISDLCRVLECDGKPVCIFGTAFHPTGGVIWMVGTDEVKRFAHDVLRHGRLFIREMRGLYPRLFNLVDARHVESIKFLHWLGFQFQGEYMIGDVPFIPFTMEGDYV